MSGAIVQAVIIIAMQIFTFVFYCYCGIIDVFERATSKRIVGEVMLYFEKRKLKRKVFYLIKHNVLMHRILITLFVFAAFTQLHAQNIPNAETGPAAATYKKNLPLYNLKKAASFQRVYTAIIPMQDTGLLNMNAAYSDVSIATQYFDQLGRPLQTVAKQATPSGKDVVSASVYDGFGRMPVQYMPYAATTGNGIFKTNALADDSAFYKSLFPGEAVIYSESMLEPSPFSRVTDQYAPGNSWGGAHRGISIITRANTAADSVRLWQINITGEDDVPYSNSVYQAGSLVVQELTDEMGVKTVVYTDEQGKKILTKSQLAASPSTHYTGWLCTYYVYDELNHLRAVIPPKAVSGICGASLWDLAANSTINTNLCYAYWYDNRGRVLMKRIPGKGKVYFAYDKLDRLVMTQDENLRLTNQWTFIKYDVQSRPFKTGLITLGALTKDQVQTNAAAATDYPTLSGTFTVLAETYFDDYTWTSGSGLTSTLVTTNINSTNFITTYDAAPTYAQNILKSNRIRGKVTGTKTMVLGTSTYLYALTIYDEDGRSIQTKQVNYTGGTDVATIQYGFSGRILRSLLSHQKSSNGNETHILLTKYNYDNGGRLQNMVKNIDGLGDKTISALTYNELGQVQNKTLGNNLSVQNYSYNIRGWLNGINKAFVESNGGTNPYFGEVLNYDFGFGTKQYNGNITGAKWKTAGDGIARAFGYSYDNNNRLTKADFTQQNEGATAWTKDKIDFSVSGIGYDANGNISAMKQRGMKVNASVTIDSLEYSYLSNSNQVSKIKDFISDTDPWGDFKDTSLTSNDYVYDVNGNIVKDNNKHIHTSVGGNGITYNFLDKVDNINVNGKGSIAYIYDAGGMLLQKTAIDTKTGLKTITTFLTGFVYQRSIPIANSGGTDTLQYVLHEEGRIRNSMKTNMSTMAVSFSLEYDYFLKDHLGNIRTTLTDEQRTDAYPMAKMETTSAGSDNLYYFNIETTKIDKPANYPVDTAYSNPNQKVAKVNGSGNKIGPAMILKVMAGDKFNLQVNSWYNTNGATPGAPVDPLSDIISAITNSVPLIAGGKILQSQLTSTVLNPSVTGFLTNRESNFINTKPKAYINWILFDEQMNPVITSDGKNSGAEQVAGNNVYKTHTISQREITKNGYLYIYVSNETPNIDVYFDQLQVTHIRGPLLSESAYYPFGLEMKGISSQAATVTTNAFKFNAGTELEERFDVDYYETFFRRYDAQIGRFTGVDVMAEEYLAWTPYSFALDNPIYFNDPMGSEVYDGSKEGKKLGGLIADPGASSNIGWDWDPVGDDLRSFGVSASGVNDDNKTSYSGLTAGEILAAIIKLNKDETGWKNLMAISGDFFSLFNGDGTVALMGEAGSDYRKNGPEYNYVGGVVQNWSNENGDRYAVFQDTQTGQFTIFPGASITDFGVIEGAGVTTANGGIHMSTVNNGLADLQHEYGHYLQASNYGESYFYGVIVPASVYSASTNSYSEHQSFWTETDANAWATLFFGSNSAIGLSSSFPKKFAPKATQK